MSRSFKVLHVAARDVTLKAFLLPFLDRLLAEGYQVHIACSNGQHITEFKARGYTVHTITIERRISPLSNLKSLWYLYRLIKKEQFDIVHVHTPIAAALGRVAAWAAGVPIIIYTNHGFYLHENMPQWKRRVVIWVEKLLCYITDLLFTVNSEDSLMAMREGICPGEKMICIGTGVDTGRFTFDRGSNGARESLGFCAQDKVIGFVGRLVADKGILELGEAMNLVVKAIPDAKLLIVGDISNSERDKNAKKTLHSMLERYGLEQHVVFTGFLEDTHIPGVMAAIDLLVHPSYREGIPNVVLEAMASSKPVVATDIRGNREAVVHGMNGLLVPVKNHTELAEAIIRILPNPELAQQMGAEGRRRTCELFDERIVIEKLVKAYSEIVRKKLVCGPLEETKMVQKRFQRGLKRVIDIAASTLSLIVLSLPFLVIAVCIKLDSPGAVFLRQERIGKQGRPFRKWKFRSMVVDAIERGLNPAVANGMASPPMPVKSAEELVGAIISLSRQEELAHQMGPEGRQRASELAAERGVLEKQLEAYNVTRNDPRITRVGKVLREFGLDELAQLINVFLGDMSIVGPRPAPRFQVEQYDDFHRQRFLVRPGITGLAIVKGRNLLSWNERIKLDVWYINHWSLWLDIKIIFQTFWAVLVKRKGIYGAEGTNDNFVSSKYAFVEQGADSKKS